MALRRIPGPCTLQTRVSLCSGLIPSLTLREFESISIVQRLDFRASRVDGRALALKTLFAGAGLSVRVSLTESQRVCRVAALARAQHVFERAVKYLDTAIPLLRQLLAQEVVETNISQFTLAHFYIQEVQLVRQQLHEEENLGRLPEPITSLHGSMAAHEEAFNNIMGRVRPEIARVLFVS